MRPRGVRADPSRAVGDACRRNPLRPTPPAGAARTEAATDMPTRPAGSLNCLRCAWWVGARLAPRKAPRNVATPGHGAPSGCRWQPFFGPEDRIWLASGRAGGMLGGPQHASTGTADTPLGETMVASTSLARDARRPAPPWGKPFAFGALDARELAVQDWLVLSYLFGFLVAVLLAPPSDAQRTSLPWMMTLCGVALGAIWLVRSRTLVHPILAPLVYRIGVYGTVQASYFALRYVLPAVTSRRFDLQLYHLDLALFGFEPALLVERWTTPALTEYFAFFYYGYFFLLAAHVLPMLLAGRNERRLGEMGLGLLLVVCLGHTIYALVPAYGPFLALAHHFQAPLVPGFWLALVDRAVASGGAGLDVFPSLHTALPTFLALYSFRHRRSLPFRFTWPITALIAAHILASTMVLRWHYLIDVLAGLALASAAFASSRWIVAWELERRRRLGATQQWPLFDWRGLSRRAAPVLAAAAEATSPGAFPAPNADAE